MGRIRVLPDTVANKIAAGEVVERPASVVKELLENSLDAGATSVRIEIESGGRRLIRITDDGSGMLRDDALLAFERHATSKLRDVKDLLSIATLGFRGEALPSIASVSRLQLETRAREEQTGTSIEIAGGKMLRCDEAAFAGGTAITVRDLFFNVPARKKFLRSEQTELAHIAQLVTHYSLAHPDKTFELRSGAEELLYVTPVASLQERVYQVFGSQTLEDLVDLGTIEKTLTLPPPRPYPGEEEEPAIERTYRMRGFISRPQVQKSNRNSIYIFVNGRLIRDRLILHALSSAYHNLIPPACFPIALLFLECDAEEVDVNVHPSKTEVRFRHQNFVHDFVRDLLRERLIESRPAPSFAVSPQPQPAAGLPYSEFSQMVADGEPFAGLTAPPPPEPRLDFSAPPIAISNEPVKLKVPDTHGPFPEGALPAPSASLTELGDLRALGQIHESFIIAVGRDGLWIIDQHVAHERILFEQVLKARAAGGIEVQRLLMPIVVQLTPEQQIRYAQIADEMTRSGFETAPFGNRTIAIQAAPAAIPQAELERVLFEILENTDPNARNVSLDDLRRNIAASIACRAAIKINMPLDARKIEWLISSLAATDYPMACPHGRPIALRYPMREILKAFHRI